MWLVTRLSQIERKKVMVVRKHGNKWQCIVRLNFSTPTIGNNQYIL